MNKKQNFIVWGILLLLSLFFYYNTITSPVKDRHAWASADHFAISLGFIENGFDFFHPETKCLNPQFPANNRNYEKPFWSNPIEHAKGITAVDFPIHHYAIASIMYILKTDQTYVYRIYMLLISLIGLFYLYKTSMLLTSSNKYSIFLVIFLFLSPTFSFYASSFLPSQASFSLLMIAGFQYLKFYKTQKDKYFYYFLLLLLIASLARLPFTIYLIAICSLFIFEGIIHKIFQWKKILLSILLINIVLLYFFYNKLYLYENYGSNFLNHATPVTSFTQFFEVLKGSIFHQSWRYLTLVQYVILLIISYQLIKNKSNFLHFKKHQQPFYFLLISSIGIFVYMLLMLPQFVSHDYYILDTFLPILIYFMMSVYRIVPPKLLKKIFLALCIFGFILNRIVYMYGYAERKTDLVEQTRKNFLGSNATLDSLKINKSDRILLIDSYCPNLAFINMKRKGYVIMDTSYENIKNGLNWDYDYIITQNFSYQESVLKSYPNFENETEIFFTNNKFTIHTKK